MTKLQRRIIAVLSVLCLLVTVAAFGSAVWCERDLEQRGISIEELLKK